ncbi:MAG TPA: c-type cytochrome, partial [Terriglobales bacterium]|nr:c-type cytochrome [Terriglobales bacterium]
ETWLFVPSWGEPTPAAAQFAHSYGPVKSGSVMAFKVVNGSDGGPSLQPVWMSGDIAVPDPVAIAGGVAFVVGTGENPQQVMNGDISKLLHNRESRNTGHAILYALDARTGQQLWSSADTMSSWTHFSGLAVGDGKVYATTHDGAIYAFGARLAGAAAAKTWKYAKRTATTPAVAAAAPASPSTAASVPQCGETNQVFVQHCAACHGPDGKGERSRHTPDFTDPSWQQAHSDKDLTSAISNGTDSGMPGFSDQLSPAQIDSLAHCMIRGFAAAVGR